MTTRSMVGAGLALFCWNLFPGGAFSQQLAPSLKDVFYGTEQGTQQLLDVYQTKLEEGQLKPAIIYIHGGGWRAGSKNSVYGFLRQGVAEGKFHVVSVAYRFTDVAIHPAQTHDCIRAIQFVRRNAREWGIDPKRIGVTGGSAGGHLSQWVALHDDMANPKSEDPVARESSRVQCAVPFAGPSDWSLLSKIPHHHPAYRQLLGYEPGAPAENMDQEKKKDVSPISFVSQDDPPMLIVHGDKDTVVPFDHAQSLYDKLKATGVTCELMVIPGGQHNVAGGAIENSPQRALEFFAKHLGF